MLKSKRGQAYADTLSSLIVGTVAIGIILVVGFLILAEGKTQVISQESSTFCDSGWTYQTSGNKCCNSTEGTCLGANMTNAGTSLGYNGTTETQLALSDIPGWLSIIIVAIIGVVLLGLVALFRSRN